MTGVVVVNTCLRSHFPTWVGYFLVGLVNSMTPCRGGQDLNGVNVKATTTQVSQPRASLKVYWISWYPKVLVPDDRA